MKARMGVFVSLGSVELAASGEFGELMKVYQ